MPKVNARGFFLRVPRVWEKVAEKMKAVGASITGVKKAVRKTFILFSMDCDHQEITLAGSCTPVGRNLGEGEGS
eukprot:SAG31_NODE_2154_length_6312_cov_3.684050_2_plen_74_part_00